jgi:sulfopyruvate decarboxylase subunit beta
MKGHEAIEKIVRALKGDELVISANGMISRELFAVKDSANNFYMLGSMGLASSIGLGLALTVPNRKIVVLDGDGNLLMNMGSLATIANLSPRNFVQIVLDNESYVSTGGQPTASGTVELEKVARSCGFKLCRRIEDANGLETLIEELLRADGPTLVLVKIESFWKQVPRVARRPEDIRSRFRDSAKHSLAPALGRKCGIRS